MIRHSTRVLMFCMALTMMGATASWGADAKAAPDASPKLAPKKTVFAHYMGCWPAGAGSMWWARNHQVDALRHEPGKVAGRGGHIRNWPLVPPGKAMTLEQSADLEIRRAMRIGIDGFAVDAWAGGKTAQAMLDAMFKVAEEKQYPFQLTVCIDPMCGGSPYGTVKGLLKKHGKSPNLARRDGKPLVFGYMSVFPAVQYWGKYAPKDERGFNPADRVTPAGWAKMGEAFEGYQKLLGQPIFFHFCMSGFYYGVKSKHTRQSLVDAAGLIAKHVGAVGSFNQLWDLDKPMAKAVKAAGAEWSSPVGMYQKENVPYEYYIPKDGTSWLRFGWTTARQTDATLLQIITWNDYGENTNIAPAYNTRYTLYNLTGYYIKWWKTGKQPVPDHDQVYLIYRKYPHGAKVFPFVNKVDKPGVFEVFTILTKPATIKLPGRNIEYQAPAGLHVAHYPVTPGAVQAQLVRDGKVVLDLKSPEPITDRPFREDNSFVCYSSEFDREWKADFGDTPKYQYSEYGDDDGDGLPNWFEMYWFSKFSGSPVEGVDAQKGAKYTKWMDMSTDTWADPKADADHDGKTNLEEYLAQTRPTPPLPKDWSKRRTPNWLHRLVTIRERKARQEAKAKAAAERKAAQAKAKAAKAAR